jgi:hypothetical protein
VDEDFDLGGGVVLDFRILILPLSLAATMESME